MLAFRDLTYRIAGRVLLDHVSATIPAGHKVGLVGRNGTGKSTLFKIICGELQTETGGVELPNDCKIAKLPQEPPGGEMTPIGYVLAADTEREALLIEADELENSTSMEDAERIAAVHMRLAEIDAHTAPARAAVILAGLGFDEAAQNRPLDSFSGGWRMRVALAGCLFAEPDLLLLDEPTASLDLAHAYGVLQLARRLAARGVAVAAVLHDLSLAYRYSDRVLVLKDCRAEALGDPRHVLDAALVRRVFNIETQVVDDCLLIRGPALPAVA